jgi:hypothetical protein
MSRGFAYMARGKVTRASQMNKMAPFLFLLLWIVAAMDAKKVRGADVPGQV